MEGSKGAFESFLKSPVGHIGRAAALGGMLFATDCVGHSCGHSEGLDEGRAQASQAARHCVEASRGRHLDHIENIQTRYSLETGDPYFDLEELRAFCREELALQVPETGLALSANSTFADGTKVKIGDIIKTVPVETTP